MRAKAPRAMAPPNPTSRQRSEGILMNRPGGPKSRRALLFFRRSRVGGAAGLPLPGGGGRDGAAKLLGAQFPRSLRGLLHGAYVSAFVLQSDNPASEGCSLASRWVHERAVGRKPNCETPPVEKSRRVELPARPCARSVHVKRGGTRCRPQASCTKGRAGSVPLCGVDLCQGRRVELPARPCARSAQRTSRLRRNWGLMRLSMTCWPAGSCATTAPAFAFSRSARMAGLEAFLYGFLVASNRSFRSSSLCLVPSAVCPSQRSPRT